MLAGSVTPRGLRIGLRAAELTLVVLDAAGAHRDELRLHGLTYDDGLSWAAQRLGGAARGAPHFGPAKRLVAALLGRHMRRATHSRA